MAGLGRKRKLSLRKSAFLLQPFLEFKEKENTWGAVYKFKCFEEWKRLCKALKDLQVNFTKHSSRISNKSHHACFVYKNIKN